MIMPWTIKLWLFIETLATTTLPIILQILKVFLKELQAQRPKLNLENLFNI